MHPALYTGVARQIARTTAGELQAPEATSVLLSAVARDLFRTDISWGKVSVVRADTDNISSHNPDTAVYHRI